MSNILISGCGITFQGKEPTWAKVFRLAGANMKDVSGPAISNDLIVNSLIEELYKNLSRGIYKYVHLRVSW